MKTHHTEGDWTLYDPDQQRPTTARGNPSDKRIMVLHPDGARVIACMETGYVHPTKGPIPREERLANARLTASAPKMLDMLERCEAWLSTIPEGRTMQLLCQEIITTATQP
jgi:hypothetical protein